MDSVPRAREFFAPRAATWDERFPDDEAARAASGWELVDLDDGDARHLANARRT